MLVPLVLTPCRSDTIYPRCFLPLWTSCSHSTSAWRVWQRELRADSSAHWRTETRWGKPYRIVLEQRDIFIVITLVFNINLDGVETRQVVWNILHMYSDVQMLRGVWQPGKALHVPPEDASAYWKTLLADILQRETSNHFDYQHYLHQWPSHRFHLSWSWVM